jgi:transcriptional regulator with XRE-family HTH domain
MPRKTEPTYLTEQGDFPTRLRELMKEKGVKQAALAKVIEMRPQTVSLYTTGQSVPDVNTLRKMSEFFGVSADWLIGCAGAVKTVDENAAAAEKYTGLSETAIELLHSISGQREKMALISALIENGVFQKSILDDLIELEKVQMAVDLDRFGVTSSGECPMGNKKCTAHYLIDSFEYFSVLEYRISREFGLVVDEITRPTGEE